MPNTTDRRSAGSPRPKAMVFSHPTVVVHVPHGAGEAARDVPFTAPHAGPARP